MPPCASRVRVILRWSHILLGTEILCYIYSPFSEYFYFRMFTRIFVAPGLVVSGVWLWKFNQVNKLFGIR